MKVLAYDPHPKAEFAKEYGFEYSELNNLFAQSDVITLHVPYMPATHHLINKENLKTFKKAVCSLTLPVAVWWRPKL